MPDRAVAAAASQQFPPGHGDRAHRSRPALVAFRVVRCSPVSGSQMPDRVGRRWRWPAARCPATVTGHSHDPVLVAFQGGALLAGVWGPRSAPLVVAAAGQQLAPGDGDRAHRIDPVLVAFQVVRCSPVWGPRSAPCGRRCRWPAGRTGDGDRAHAVDPSWWPSRSVRCWPVSGSQIRTVSSSLALASSSRPATVTGHSAADRVLVAFQGGALLAGLGVPDPHRRSSRCRWPAAAARSR